MFLRAGLLFAVLFSVSCGPVGIVEAEPHIEEAGGYVFTPPKSWYTRDNYYNGYKTFVGPREVDKSVLVTSPALIMFFDEPYSGPIDDVVDSFVDSYIDGLNLLPESKDIKTIYREDFETDKKLKGKKAIVTMTLPVEDEYDPSDLRDAPMRWSIYFFPGNGKIMLVICSVLASTGNVYDETFDNSMRTFEWL